MNEGTTGYTAAFYGEVSLKNEVDQMRKEKFFRTLTKWMVSRISSIKINIKEYS